MVMIASLGWIGAAVCLLVGGAGAGGTGYLALGPAPAGSARAQVVPYVPRQGDLIFYDDHSPVWTALFALAGTGPPLHMGIVVRRPGGALAVLEAGPDDRVWVELLDLGPRLHQFQRDFQGTILVRRCKVALSAQRSAALTRFAQAQMGKRYAVLRLLAQGTPLRSRGTLEPWLAETRLDRDSWICSELAVVAGTVAGLFDPKVVRANVTYPRDLVDNQRYDLNAPWDQPARWQPDCRQHPAAAPAGQGPPGRPQPAVLSP
jgi:hypothetical protein